MLLIRDAKGNASKVTIQNVFQSNGVIHVIDTVRPVGIARVVVGNSSLRRFYPVLCALQIGNGVLPRFRPCVSFAVLSTLSSRTGTVGTALSPRANGRSLIRGTSRHCYTMRAAITRCR